jgi:hypothetical protein
MDESKYTDGFIWSVGPVFNSSEKRLARTLLLLANFGKERRPEPITTKISQETLAEIIGSINSAGSASNRLRLPLSGSSQYQASRPQPRHLLRCMSPVRAVRPEGAIPRGAR